MRIRWIGILALLAVFSMTGFAVAGNISINGSTTVLPISQKIIEVYMKENPAVNISFPAAAQATASRRCWTAPRTSPTSSRFIKDEEVKLAMEKGMYPVPFAIAYDCIVPEALFVQHGKGPDARPAQGHLHG